jgi:hypothetical protein
LNGENGSPTREIGFALADAVSEGYSQSIGRHCRTGDILGVRTQNIHI